MARTFAILAAVCLSAPAFAQSTSTTVTTQQQQPPPPPPPSTSTTVTTQPSPSTQVVVNPGQSSSNTAASGSTTTTTAPSTTTTTTPSSTTTHVRTDDTVAVETTPRNGRSSVAIVAADAVYGGVAGAVVGGGIALINQGSNWPRDLMVGGGIGILVGAAYGIYEAASQPSATVVRAEADRDPAASSVPTSLSAKVFARKF